MPTEINYGYWDNQDLLAGFNDKTPDRFFKSEINLLGNISNTNNLQVLDIGCSCGRFYDLLQSLHYQFEYTGLDISQNSLDIARANYPGSEFILGNAVNFSSHKKFNIVNATGVFQHETHYRELLINMLNLAKDYVLFDVKITPLENTYADVEKLYCMMGEAKIPMVVLAYTELISLINELANQFSVSLLAYSTPSNSSTYGPKEVTENWASCGVLIDKNTQGPIHILSFPDKWDGHAK